MNSIVAVIAFAMLSPLTAWSFSSPDFYTERVEPLFNRRCIQCHSCYNAPCQLKLTSVEGLDRGLVKNYEVYDSKRLRSIAPSRLAIDRKTAEEWHQQKNGYQFYPITSSGSDESFISILVAHKAGHPDLMPNDFIDYSHKQSEFSRICPTSLAELKQHLMKRPDAGMPYGLPPLDPQQIADLQEWTQQGSPRPSPMAVVPDRDQKIIGQVEDFLNSYLKTSENKLAQKQSLVSRYLYEHLYISHLYFRAEPHTFYRLVRSSRQCSQGIDEIATRRPWDSTGQPFFYCLQPIHSALVHKTHITYFVDEQKVQRWSQLFFGSTWEVQPKAKDWWAPVINWPGLVSWYYNHLADAEKRNNYFFFHEKDVLPRDDLQASNPFYIFSDIPVKARYQFLLDDAANQVMTFIRGPVCKGNTAVNSIDEQFYTFFIRPDSDLMVQDFHFAQAAQEFLRLPAYMGSEQAGGIQVGYKLRDLRNHYRLIRDQAYGTQFPQGYGVNDIWNGAEVGDIPNGPNSSAALTIFRNYDSASIVKGLVGATPKTIFVLDYALLERLVYLLVTGFDVYGDVSHQVLTRIYMGYLRMEAEELFLSFLPTEVRKPMRHSWYIPANGTTERVGRLLDRLRLQGGDRIERRYPLYGTERPTQMAFEAYDPALLLTPDPLLHEEFLRNVRREFAVKVRNHLGLAIQYIDVLNPDKGLDESTSGMQFGEIQTYQDFERELARVMDVKAMGAPWVLKMPSLSSIVVRQGSESEIYTLIRNKEHFNVAWIGGEDGRRRSNLDSMTAYHGVLGSYPNHIFVFDLSQAREFLAAMVKIKDHSDYERWLQQFGSPRIGPGSERFWANSDLLHQVFREKFPVEFGAFDYNRYGIDYRFNNDESYMEEYGFMKPGMAELE